MATMYHGKSNNRGENKKAMAIEKSAKIRRRRRRNKESISGEMTRKYQQIMAGEIIEEAIKEMKIIKMTVNGDIKAENNLR